MNSRLAARVAKPVEERRAPATAAPSFLTELLGFALIIATIASVGIATAVLVQPIVTPERVK